MKGAIKITSYLSLIVMTVSPMLVLAGTIGTDLNKIILLITTVLWFVTAPSWMKASD